jgi:hypothetical protein
MNQVHGNRDAAGRGGRREQPIDLHERFGSRYRVEFEESYYAEHGPHATVNDPWLQIIPGRLGHIYPFGGELMAASTDSRGPIAKRLAVLPFCQVYQDGDDGVTVVFHVKHLREVAKVIRARTTRKLSPEAKQRLLDAGAKNRFRENRPEQVPVPEAEEVVLSTRISEEKTDQAA